MGSERDILEVSEIFHLIYGGLKCNVELNCSRLFVACEGNELYDWAVEFNS